MAGLAAVVTYSGPGGGNRGGTAAVHGLPHDPGRGKPQRITYVIAAARRRMHQRRSRGCGIRPRHGGSGVSL